MKFSLPSVVTAMRTTPEGARASDFLCYNTLETVYSTTSSRFCYEKWLPKALNFGSSGCRTLSLSLSLHPPVKSVETFLLFTPLDCLTPLDCRKLSVTRQKQDWNGNFCYSVAFLKWRENDLMSVVMSLCKYMSMFCLWLS